MAKPRLKINIVANWNHVSTTAIAQNSEYMRASTAIMRAPADDCVVASDYQQLSYCNVESTYPNVRYRTCEVAFIIMPGHTCVEINVDMFVSAVTLHY